MLDGNEALVSENRRLRQETRELRERIASIERSRWWRLHPRLLFHRRAPTPAWDVVDGRFDPDVHATLREGSKRSAAVVARVVQEIVRARSVLDVGGGEGWWSAAFALLGARCVSIDDSAPGELAEGVEHVQHDLRLGLLPSLGRFDLALCLEVVEHLGPDDGKRIVDAVCSVAPAVLFSAAIPGQGGHGHVNEQWPRYWVETFDAYGFRCSGALRWHFWEDERIEPWYRQNLLFATDDPERFPALFETPLADPWPVVHPRTFARRLDS